LEAQVVVDEPLESMVAPLGLTKTQLKKQKQKNAKAEKERIAEYARISARKGKEHAVWLDDTNVQVKKLLGDDCLDSHRVDWIPRDRHDWLRFPDGPSDQSLARRTAAMQEYMQDEILVCIRRTSKNLQPQKR